VVGAITIARRRLLDSLWGTSMSAKDVFTYQFGNSAAIRRIAGGKYSLAVGAALVLITSVPRNYDQT
jgi:hypothetical protein